MALSIAKPGSTYAYNPTAAPIGEKSTIMGASQASIPKNYSTLEREKYLPTMPASYAGTPTEAVWKKIANKVADAKFQAAAIGTNSWSYLPLSIQTDLQEQIKAVGKEAVIANLDAAAAAAMAELVTLMDPAVRNKINTADPTYTPPGLSPQPPTETPDQKAFRIGKERFMSDVIPRIQEGLNAQGLLESGATPHALAQALKDSAETTSNEQLNKLMTDINARYAPVNALAQQMRGNALQQSTQLNANRIAQMLQNMSFEAQQPAQPDILAQLLGTGAGAGLTTLLTRRRRGSDLSTLIPSRSTAGTTTMYGMGSLPY